MDNSAFTAIENYYNQLVEKHGDSYKACDYGRQESQLVKFQTLAEATDLNGKTVLDVGCGTGDFFAYLSDRYAIQSYTGIDLSEKMIATCQSKFAHALFEQKNILNVSQQYDYICANGIFYLLGDQALETMQVIIRHMFELAKVAVAFNTLSAWSSNQEGNEFYADPIQIIDYCRKITSKIVLRHDYLPHDFTIYMYK